MLPADASAFYAKNVATLLELMVEATDDGLAFKDFAADEVTQATLAPAD
jgi:NAD(P) transhydrogenase subunit alpha